MNELLHVAPYFLLRYFRDMANLEDYQTTEQAAERLGVQDRRIRQLCTSSELDCTKMGGVWLVRTNSWPTNKGIGRPPIWQNQAP